MLNKKIKYIAFYNEDFSNNDNRNVSPALVNKVNYICSVLEKNNYEVDIISPSWTNNKSGFYKGRIKNLSESIRLINFATFGAKIRITRILKYIFSLSQLFFYLLFKTNKYDSIIIYHSVILSIPVRLAKLIKRFQIILEVEEIYQDIQNLPKYMKKMEYAIFGKADKFIFSTELLNEKLNKDKRPSVVVYGTYKVEKKRSDKFDDGKIHIVYAGTFDSRKGGATAAVSAAEFLPQKYHLHIIGFGSEEDTKLLLEKIQIASKNSAATITYDGFLEGEEYIRFLQRCHIGLSTQNPDGVYNETSFPSKILSYLANGLRVVSARLKAIEMSKIGKAVYYYDEQTPQAIAKAIMSIDINAPYDSRKLINELDGEFTKNIGKLLGC